MLATPPPVAPLCSRNINRRLDCADCDYLCDGTADQTEINAAINRFLPATGGEIVILDGTYNITAKIDVTKDNVKHQEMAMPLY